MPDIRPGLQVDFFFYADYEKETIHVMHSILHEVTGKKMVMAQPSSGILRSSIQKNIIVTYLTRKEGQSARCGFSAKITELVNDYEIVSGETVSAVVIEREDDPHPFDIRLHYRLKVPSASGLVLRIRGEKALLLDISIGGAMISGADPPVRDLEEHARIGITVGFDAQRFELEAEVQRVWSSPGPDDSRDVRVAALKFINAPPEFENALSKKILTLERQLLARNPAKGETRPPSPRQP